MTTPPPVRIALVTGARGGIGRAVVAQLRAQGCLVAAVGRDAETLAAVDADAHVAADTTTAEGASAAMAACTAHLGGPPSLLAHCVGSTLIAPLHRSSPHQIGDVLRINLVSALFMLQAWIEGLRAAGQPGAAVLASSVVARIGVANHEVIAAAKGGIEALARSAAATYAPMGLRINAVAPGMTDDGLDAPRRCDARRRRQAVPVGRCPDGGAGGGRDGLVVVGERQPHHRPSDRGGWRVHDRATAGQVMTSSTGVIADRFGSRTVASTQRRCVDNDCRATLGAPLPRGSFAY
jgi:NAD(P)-dependent dehydrogenase (short-subunit alcohol dehydrogenase family)